MAYGSTAAAQAAPTSLLPLLQWICSIPPIPSPSEHPYGDGGVPDFGEPLTPAYTHRMAPWNRPSQRGHLWLPLDRPTTAAPPCPRFHELSHLRPVHSSSTRTMGDLYPVQGPGYHVPLVFRDFIERHGNFSVIGQALADTTQAIPPPTGSATKIIAWSTTPSPARTMRQHETLGQKYLSYSPPPRLPAPIRLVRRIVG